MSVNVGWPLSHAEWSQPQLTITKVPKKSRHEHVSEANVLTFRVFQRFTRNKVVKSGLAQKRPWHVENGFDCPIAPGTSGCWRLGRLGGYVGNVFVQELLWWRILQRFSNRCTFRPSGSMPCIVLPHSLEDVVLPHVASKHSCVRRKLC